MVEKNAEQSIVIVRGIFMNNFNGFKQKLDYILFRKGLIFLIIPIIGTLYIWRFYYP